MDDIYKYYFESIEALLSMVKELKNDLGLEMFREVQRVLFSDNFAIIKQNERPDKNFWAHMEKNNTIVEFYCYATNRTGRVTFVCKTKNNGREHTYYQLTYDLQEPFEEFYEKKLKNHIV